MLKNYVVLPIHISPHRIYSHILHQAIGIQSLVHSDVKMYRVEVNNKINLAFSVFYKLGLWHRGAKATVQEIRLKFFYTIFYLCYPISLIAGAITSDENDESIFLTQTSVMVMVVQIKFIYIIWRKEEILQLLNEICVYTIGDHNEFTRTMDKLRNFFTFVSMFFIAATWSCVFSAFIVPFLGSEKELYFNIAFPMDYKNDKIFFWIAFAFEAAGQVFTAYTFLFNSTMWYLMFSCSLRLETLGHRITKMGASFDRNLSAVEKNRLFDQDLIAVIKTHQHTKE